MYPDIDHMDVTARQESLAVRGEPILLQLPLNPCYALTIHKTQALSIKHLVLGCLEGVFALGQVYVLFSRVTVPQNCQLVGIPPKDLIDEVAEALRTAGFDVDACFKRAATVTGEWVYTPGDGPVSTRIVPKWSAERNIPLKCHTLSEVLNPQPQATAVIRNLLGWIDRVDMASQCGTPRPPFSTLEGEDMFPDQPWWLTELQKRAAPEDELEPGDEDGPHSGEDGQAGDAALTDDEDPPSGEDHMGGQEKLERDPEVYWRGNHIARRAPATPVLQLTRKRTRSSSSLETRAATSQGVSASSSGML